MLFVEYKFFYNLFNYEVVYCIYNIIDYEFMYFRYVICEN